MESVEEEKEEEEEAAGGVEMQHCIGTTGVECSGGRVATSLGKGQSIGCRSDSKLGESLSDESFRNNCATS